MYIIYQTNGDIIRSVEGFQVIGNELQGIVGDSRFYYYKNLGFNVAEIEDDIEDFRGLIYIDGQLIQDPNYISFSQPQLNELTEDDINNLPEADAMMLWGMLSERLLNQ